MINIFNYTDFRKYLTDYYEAGRKGFSRISYRSLTARAGINAGNFTKMLQGERKLSLNNGEKLAHALNLNKSERDYFLTMVLFGQAKNHEEKKRYFEDLMSFSKSSVRIIDSNNYHFYEKWYYTAVREALAFFPLTDLNFGELGKCIIPNISKKQVAQAISLLVNLNLVEKTEQGTYRRTDELISTGNEIHSLMLNNFVIQTMRLAEQAINQGTKGTNLSSVTLSIASKDLDAVQEEIRRCRRKIMEIAKESAAPDRVFQFNVQLFPMTQKYDEGAK